MIYAGIDYSITCPSICIYDSVYPFDFEHVKFYINQYKVSLKEKKRRDTLVLKNIMLSNQEIHERNIDRFIALAEWSISVLKNNSVENVCMEDYAFGANGKVFNIAECTGCLKYKLAKEGIKFVTFAPTEVKKYFTGKGNADKEKMVDKFKELYSVSINELIGVKKDKSPVSDIVDSFAMIYTQLKKEKENGSF